MKILRSRIKILLLSSILILVLQNITFHDSLASSEGQLPSSIGNISEQLIYESEWPSATVISPDATRIIKKGDNGQMILAGPEGKIEGKVYEGGSDVRSWKFSPDSKRWAYVAILGDNKAMAVVDGRDENVTDFDIYGDEKIIFSPNSKHYAYWAKKCDNDTCKSVMVLDGKEEPYEPNTKWPVFSPDGEHLAYETTIGELGSSENHIVSDGKLLGEGHGPTFSPDGERLAYSGLYYIIRDGEKIDLEKSGFEFVNGIYFSPDSKRFIYDVGRPPNCCGHAIVSDLGTGDEYSSAGKVVFSPDSKHFAYAAHCNGNKHLTKCTYDNRIVMDGTEQNEKGYLEVGDPIFSPDSKHLAYIAKNDSGKFVVVDGKEGKNYYDVSGLVFSNDGNHIAYRAVENFGEFSFVVVDGREMKKFDRGIFWGPILSPDGNHVVYVANPKCYDCSGQTLVVDQSEELLPYNLMVEDDTGGIVFDSNDTFHFLAVNYDKIYLVKKSIVEREAQPGVSADPNLTPGAISGQAVYPEPGSSGSASNNPRSSFTE